MGTRVVNKPGAFRLQSLNERNESPLFQRRKSAHQETGGAAATSNGDNDDRYLALSVFSPLSVEWMYLEEPLMRFIVVAVIFSCRTEDHPQSYQFSSGDQEVMVVLIATTMG